MSIKFLVELRSESSGWLLHAAHVIADTAEEAVVIAKATLPYMDQTPVKSAVTKIADIAETAVETAEEAEPEVPVKSDAEIAAEGVMSNLPPEVLKALASLIEKV